MRAIVYVRNSSGKQVAAGTHEGLVQSGHETAKRLGAEVVAVYSDRGISAKSGNLDARDEFARLVAELPQTKPDVCIVANVDRLTRTELFSELGAIWGPLQEAGVKIATAGGQVLDLNTPEGQLLAMFESWRSSRENAARAERCRAGRKRAAREGRNPGRYPIGYAWSKRDGWTAPRADLVREVYERVAAGESCESIAGDFNARKIPTARKSRWRGDVIRDIARPRRANGDPYVTGLWFGNAADPAIEVPPIVAADLAARARASLASRANRPRTSTRHVQYLDDNAATCAVCGRAIRIMQSRGHLRADGTRKRFAYYACESRAKSSELHLEPCGLPMMRTERVDEAVWRYLTAHLERPQVVERATVLTAETRETARTDLESARRQLAEDERRLAALADALGMGALTADAYRAQVQRITARRDLLAHQVSTWTAAGSAPVEPSAAMRGEVRLEVRRLTAAADEPGKRALVRRLWPRWVISPTGAHALRSGNGIGEAIPAPEISTASRAIRK